MAAVITPQIFKRSFHSEQCRQELIGKRADGIAQDLMASLIKDDAEALEVAEDMIGFMEPETMVHLMRCALRGDISGANVARQLLLTVVDESVRRIADHRAIKSLEDERPE
jgi:hypothetical protein